MKHLTLAFMLMSVLGFTILAKVDTTALFINTEALRSYCQKKCLDDGDCVEKCMNRDKEDKEFS